MTNPMDRVDYFVGHAGTDLETDINAPYMGKSQADWLIRADLAGTSGEIQCESNEIHDTLIWVTTEPSEGFMVREFIPVKTKQVPEMDTGTGSTSFESMENLHICSGLQFSGQVSSELGTGSTSWQTAKLIGDLSPNRKVFIEMLRLFKLHQDEWFEDGIGSDFVSQLENMIKDKGISAVSTLKDIIFWGSVGPDLAEEALRAMGRMDDYSTSFSRLILLEEALAHSNPRIRDGALIGLSYFDDPSSLPYIKAAMKVEKSPELKEDMQHLVDQLVTIS